MSVRVLGCALLTCWLLLGCSSVLLGPQRSLPLPQEQSARERLLRDVGRRAFSAFSHGTPARLLLDDTALRALLESNAANQAAALRASTELAMQVPPEDQALLASGTFQGLCVQGAHLLPAGPPLGLRSAGFVFDRALIAASEPNGGRVAAWIEGTFVLTDRGFYALSLQRLESPRRDHADLDLAACDLELGLRVPRQVVVQRSASY